ncbi:MAG: SEC-C metal-binding domain-containing protein [Defluviitaleaceae bacterium]|nr:SEC-C metal-binding domain-containing protein [Defluviitaleaceae bacterium]
MLLLDAWKRLAFDTQNQPVKHVWDEYLAKEKAVYVSLLKEKKSKIEGTIADLAKELRLTNVQMCAWLDGIHECVDGLPPLTEVDENTAISFTIEFDRLYKQMVEYKADALYSLDEWENIFTPEEQKDLYKQQKSSHTIVRNETKVGRNDPCTCGSGKKYKKCCGTAA